MKKTLKVLGLLAVAAALFIGCKNNADEGSGEKNIQEDLFDATELTETATTYEFADGDWTYRHIIERDDMIDATQIEFSVKMANLIWKNQSPISLCKLVLCLMELQMNR